MASAFPAVETEEKGVTLRTAACVVFFSSIGIFAYPLIYPVVDYILSIIDFAENRNFKSVIDLYNTITGNDIFPQDPVVEALSYWDKARILYFVQVTAYLSLTAITAIGAILFALSRLLPGRFLQSTMRCVALAVSFFPLVAIWLYTMAMIFISYYLAWQRWSGSFIGYLDFAILVAAFPVVWAHSMSFLIGIWAMTYFVPPSALAFSGVYSRPARMLRSFWSLALGEL